MKYLIVLFLFMTTANAADLFLFEKQKPAMADEVNHNFSILDDRLNILDQCKKPKYGIKLDVSHNLIAKNIGDVVNIDGGNYRIMAVPFVDMDNGDQYVLKYPMNIDILNPNLRFITTRDADFGELCGSELLNGYQYGFFKTSEFRNISIVDSSTVTATTSILVNYYLSIKVGSTLLRIYEKSQTLTEQTTNSYNNDSDLTDNLDYKVMLPTVDKRQFLDDKIDYISIEKLP